MPTRAQAKKQAEKLTSPKVIRELVALVPGFDTGALLSAIMESWGGQEKFASDVYVVFGAAEKGSMVRQRILDMICRLIIINTDRTHLPVEKMTEDELLTALHQIAPKLGALADESSPDAQGRSPESQEAAP